ncbi:MAG: hypothetical protein R3344_11695, partial [Acidobacteriota bacterium]|nr:hypothetical protein [Acidobacteriota bacterium]
FKTRSRVSADQLASARLAWEAFRSSNPTEIESFLVRDTAVLPFMGPALRRHLQQFPSVRNGLGRTENEILEVLAEGPAPAAAVFEQTNEREEAPFMGDAPFWIHLERLAGGARPAVRFEGEGVDDRFPGRVVTLTHDANALLHGKGDFVRWNGIDRWLGGVHLAGDDAKWRWNEQTSRLCRGRI